MLARNILHHKPALMGAVSHCYVHSTPKETRSKPMDLVNDEMDPPKSDFHQMNLRLIYVLISHWC